MKKYGLTFSRWSFLVDPFSVCFPKFQMEVGLYCHVKTLETFSIGCVPTVLALLWRIVKKLQLYKKRTNAPIVFKNINPFRVDFLFQAPWKAEFFWRFHGL